MCFEEALAHLKNGSKITRKSWNNAFSLIIHEEELCAVSESQPKPVRINVESHSLLCDDWLVIN